MPDGDALRLFHHSGDTTQLLKTRLGLVLGPLAVHGPGSFRDISAAISARFSVDVGTTYLDTADHALAGGATEDDVRRTIQETVGLLPVTAGVTRVAETRWSAVFSACLSETFEERFRQAADRHPAEQSITVYEDPARALPPRTVPVFKLLGSTLRGNFAHSTVTYMRRRSLWSSAIKQFSDQTQGGPVLCIGMSECPWLLLELLAAMTALPPSTPRALLFAVGDTLLADGRLLQAVQGHSSLLVVEASEGGILAAAAAEAIRPAAPSVATELPRKITDFADFAILVNEHASTSSDVAERERLVDLLFSPGRPSWEPFLHDFDLKRTLTGTMVSGILERLKIGGASVGAVLSGTAASGKTTLLKRVALELTRRDTLCLWLRPWLFQDGHKVLAALMSTVAANVKQDTPVIFFLDDPPTFGSIMPHHVLSASEAAGLRGMVVVGVRTSDWVTREPAELFEGWQIFAEYELTDSLDEAEWALLAPVLVKLGISSSYADAQRYLHGAPSRQTKDTLSTLYWLVPSTREAIGFSIQNEYFRLGDADGLAQVIIGSYTHSSRVLQDAYAMAAVADSYEAPLPVEVLVSALGVSYGDWIDATGPNGVAWGLLYPTGGPEDTTVYYATRNSIVTKLLIETINGGGLGHAGELRVLNALLRGCTGTQSIYREFASTLARSEPLLLARSDPL